MDKPTKGFPVRPIAEIKQSRSWAVYGRSGSGKTTFAGTFPGPTLLLDIEDKGTASISDCKHVDVAEISDWEDIEDIYDMVTDKTNKYKTVVFDTITQLQLLGANAILAKKRKPAVESLDWGVLTMQDYGKLSTMMKEKINLFRQLQMEVIFLAQERTNNLDESRDDIEIVPEVGAALTPSIAQNLYASVSVVASTFVRRRRLKKGKGEEITAVHAMRLGPHPIYTTKVRKPRSIILPDIVDNPTFKDIVEIIEGRE